MSNHNACAMAQTNDDRTEHPWSFQSQKSEWKSIQFSNSPPLGSLGCQLGIDSVVALTSELSSYSTNKVLGVWAREVVPFIGSPHCQAVLYSLVVVRLVLRPLAVVGVDQRVVVNPTPCSLHCYVTRAQPDCPWTRNTCTSTYTCGRIMCMVSGPMLLDTDDWMSQLLPVGILHLPELKSLIIKFSSSLRTCARWPLSVWQWASASVQFMAAVGAFRQYAPHCVSSASHKARPTDRELVFEALVVWHVLVSISILHDFLFLPALLLV